MYLKPQLNDSVEIDFEVYREVIHENAKKLVKVATMRQMGLMYRIQTETYSSVGTMINLLEELEQKIKEKLLETVKELVGNGNTVAATALYRNQVEPTSTLQEALSYVRNMRKL